MNGLWIALAIIVGIIVFCIAFVIFLILFGRVKIRITSAGGLRAVATVLGIRVKTYPEEDALDKKPSKPSRCKNPKRALDRELRRMRKREKAKEKKKRKKLRAQAKRRRRRGRQNPEATRPAPRLTETIADVTALIKKLYRIAHKGLKIHVKKFHVYVATEDAAKTVLAYGVVLQSVAYLMQFIETKVAHIRRDEGDMKVVADYLSQTSRAEIDIVCCVRLYKILVSGVLDDADLIPQMKKSAPMTDDTQTE